MYPFRVCDCLISADLMLVLARGKGRFDTANTTTKPDEMLLSSFACVCAYFTPVSTGVEF